MCGIAGLAGVGMPRDSLPTTLRAMCDAIIHRGPDEYGSDVIGSTALGMRRLSIIDIAGGQQPVRNEDNTVSVVFNGEIYNHHRLRAELEAQGHEFRTHCDTEVLVHLYEEHGTDMFIRLNGMFAFAIWDDTKKLLLIARDRTGMKPLSYMQHNDGIVFCSELRSLLEFPEFEPRVSSSGLMKYLAFGYVPDPGSIFEGVKKLPPAHYLTWRAGEGIDVQRYWRVSPPTETTAAQEDLVDTLRSHLSNAVSAHLGAGVPLGGFLSGGLDSSTVVALMCKTASERVRTFSIGFKEKEFDESGAARMVADQLGTLHTDLILEPDVEGTLDAISVMFDEPFGDSSAIPTFFVSQLARQSVTVALSGDGGDELFGGYTRYTDMLGLRRSYGTIGRLLSTVGSLLPHIAPGRNRLLDLGRSRWGRYAAQVAGPLRVDEGGVAKFGIPGADCRIENQLEDHLREDFGEDFAAAMMALDLETYLPGDILTKIDRTSMAVSLEARVPLLDIDLMEFALALPGSKRAVPGESKRLFRRAIQGIVPDFVLNRPKQGFAIPLSKWFRGPLRGRIEALRNPSAELNAYVDVGAVRRLVTEHTMGRRDHSVILWRLIVLDSWFGALRNGSLNASPTLPDLTSQTA